MIIDQDFFIRYQSKILWLINTKIGGWIFGLKKIGHNLQGRKIERVMPNSLRFLDKKGIEENTYTEKIHTHNVFAIRLAKILFWLPVVSVQRERERFILQPAYQLAFYALVIFAFNKTGIPVFFGTTTTFNTHAGTTSPIDGYVENDVSTWAAAHDNTTGTATDASVGAEGRCGAEKISGSRWICSRSVINFDTTVIGAGATISAASLTLMEYAGDHAAVVTDTFNIVIHTITNTTLATSDMDYNKWGTTSYGSILNTAISTNTAFTINFSSFTPIVKGGLSKIGLRMGNDIANTDPAGGRSFVGWHTADDGSNIPVLSVTYTTSTAYTSTLTETVTHTDTLLKSTVRTLTETVSHTATFLSQKIQSATLTETVNTLATMLEMAQRTFTETVTTTATMLRTATRVFTETVSTSDVVIAIKIQYAVLSEALSMLDTMIRVTAREFIETVTHTATFTALNSHIKNLTDTITTSDTFVYSRTLMRSMTLETVNLYVNLVTRLNGIVTNFWTKTPRGSDSDTDWTRTPKN